MFLFIPNLEELAKKEFLFSVLDAIDKTNTILVHLIQTNRSFLSEEKKTQMKGNLGYNMCTKNHSSRPYL